MNKSDEIITKLKEYDAWMDAHAKSPEKAEYGKQEIRKQIDKMPSDSLKLVSLNAGLQLLKRMEK